MTARYAPPPVAAAAVAAPPPPRPRADEALAGARLTLAPLMPAQAAVFERLQAASHGDSQKEAIWNYLPYGPFAAAADMRACYAKMAQAGDPLFYCVMHGKTPAGVVSFLNINPEAYSIEIGHIWHAASQHGGAANTEAAFLLAQHAFALGYRRLEWKCNALNDKSRRAALRLGFAFEGVFRQHLVVKGKNRDTAWFALLDKDWQTAKQNFENWLQKPGAFSLAAANLPLVAWSLPAHDAWRAAAG